MVVLLVADARRFERRPMADVVDDWSPTARRVVGWTIGVGLGLLLMLGVFMAIVTST